MTVRLEPIESVNLGEQAYCRLRLALLDGRYRPNERLRLRDLAAELGTSVTPVREAVLRLVNDGALRLRNQRDIRVRALSADEVLEIAAIRKPLESLAIERFTEVMTERHLEELEALYDRYREALAERDYRRALSLDRRLMLTIFKSQGQPIFVDTLDRVWLVMRPTMSLLYSDEGVAKIDLGNDDLLEALRARDVKAARKARCRLIDDTAAVVAEMLREREAALKTESA
jgi:DNA-binding GntR family transcriptional regulator